MKGVINNIFFFFLILAIPTALYLVVIQIVFAVVANGPLAIWTKNTLQTPTCILCSFSALIAFVISYLSKPAKED